MNDPNAPKPAMNATLPSAAELLHLSRIVEGLADSDLLIGEDGGALLAEITAAGRAWDAGDPAVACRHMARFVQSLEELVGSRALDAADGRPALEAARRLLAAY